MKDKTNGTINLKSTIIEMKNPLEGFNSRFELVEKNQDYTI